MIWKWISGSMCLCLAWSWATAEDTILSVPAAAYRSPAPLIDALVQAPVPPAPEPPAPAQPDAFAQAPAEQGGEAPASYSPTMVGDFPGLFACRTVVVQGTQIIRGFQTILIPVPDEPPIKTIVPFTKTVVTSATQTVCVPIASYGSFKIAENESPEPQDRVFFTYNFYNNVTAPATGSNLPRTQTVTTTINGFPATITTLVPGVPIPALDVNRETVGFETTFMDGTGSFGLRAPLTQTTGDGGFGASDFGDVTAILKYALFNDPVNRNLVSGGLAVTAPTGPGIETISGTIRSTLLQPYGGFVWNDGALYLHGLTSVVFPTDPRDVTILFNDVGVGYRLYQSAGAGFITSLIPTLELHVNTPLNHGEPDAPIIVPDLVDLTIGAHVGVMQTGWLTVGIVTPVSGPHPFDAEAVVQFNRRF